MGYFSKSAGSAQEANKGAHYEYSPFGRVISASGGSLGTSGEENSFRFSTKYTDPETSLYYYGFRYYNPTHGRWLSRDPIEERGGWSLYAFSGNNGIDAWDLLGMAPGDIHKTNPDPKGYKSKDAAAMAAGREIRQMSDATRSKTNPTGNEFKANIGQRPDGSWTYGNASEGGPLTTTDAPKVEGATNKGDSIHTHPDTRHASDGDLPFSKGPDENGNGDMYNTAPGTTNYNVQSDGSVYAFDQPILDYEKYRDMKSEEFQEQWINDLTKEDNIRGPIGNVNICD